MNTRRVLLLVGAAGVLVSAYVHYYLYFHGGYRGISPERVLGLDISRSFALNAIAGVVIAEVLVLSLRFERLAIPAAIIGVLFAVGAMVGYFLARTSGLLGFTENQTTVEAVISKIAELIAVASLGTYVLTSIRAARPATAGVSPA